MSLELLKNKELNSRINKFYKKHKTDILDIVLFGSSARGKQKPNDLDILLLFKEKENLDISYGLKKELEFLGIPIQIISKTYFSLQDNNFKAKEAYLSEGISLIKKQPIAESFGYSNFILFKYQLTDFSQSKRMQFQYALYGRDKHSGIMQKLKLTKFADGAILSPLESADEVIIFLNSWNIKYNSHPLLIPTRLL